MQTTEEALLKQTLAEHNFSVTHARLELFRILLHSGPQPMREILAQARGKIDRVSVYRNIDLFEKIGIVHRIYIGWKYKIELSDRFVSHHHHVSCLKCGKVIDIQDEKHIDEFISHISKQLEFTPVNHQFEISGYCSTCQRV